MWRSGQRHYLASERSTVPMSVFVNCGVSGKESFSNIPEME